LEKWYKREDVLEIKAEIKTSHQTSDNQPVKKSKILLSRLSSVYDPLGIILPTMVEVSPTIVEGKGIYRDVCDEYVGWNAGVSNKATNEWLKCTNQLRNVHVPIS